ncbi:dinitrogenase iron-molybdenum cofactor biosynthesis protein, partial [Archaeoglobales archaeon]
MKVCVPSYKGGLDDFVCEHFGRATTFTIYDTETGEVSVVRNTSEHFGGFGKPPELLRKIGVDVIVCSGMGARAI